MKRVQKGHVTLKWYVTIIFSLSANMPFQRHAFLCVLTDGINVVFLLGMILT